MVNDEGMIVILVIEQKGVDEEVEKNKGKHDEAYWSTYAIKIWLREWFRQKRVEEWTIDKYDGQESYEEFDLKPDAQHWKEAALEPKLFKQMRSTMVMIEAEMDEVLDESTQTVKANKLREWSRPRDVALSICNDYAPDVQMGIAEAS